MSYQASPYQSLADLNAITQQDEETGQGNVRLPSTNDWATTIPIKMDLLAALTYFPLFGIVVLLKEFHSTYVRFNAWQASMVHLILLFLHFFIMFLSSVLSWILFAFDVIFLIYLGAQAYRGADHFTRYELPVIGEWASQFVDSE